MEPQDQLERVDHLELQEPQDLVEHLETRESLEPLVRLALLEHKVPLDRQERTALPEPQVRQVDQEARDPQGYQVPPDLQDLQVQQDRPALMVRWAALEHRDKQDSRAVRARLGPRGVLDHRGLAVAPVTQGDQDLRGRVVARGPQVPRVTPVHQGLQDPQDLKVPLDRLDQLVKLDKMDHRVS